MAKAKTGMALPKRSEPKPPPHSKSVDAGYKPTFRGGRKPSEENEGPMAMAEDRRSVYEEYQKTQGLANGSLEPDAVPPETSPAADEPEVPPVEGTPEPTPETPEPEVPALGEPSDKGEDHPEKKPGEQAKTVPHAALHEEREKHKLTRTERDTLKAENAELAKQQAELLRTTQSLVARMDTLTKAPPVPKKDETPTPIADPEAEIRRLQSRLDSLEGTTSTFVKQSAEQRRAAMVQDLNTRIATTNADLEKEGLKGFDYFLDQVTAEVRRQLKPDNSNAAEVDTPDNWKRIYKEKVFPRVKGMFAPQVKAAKVEEKKILKKEAGLVDTAGSAENTAEPEKKEWTFADYVEFRRKRGVS